MKTYYPLINPKPFKIPLFEGKVPAGFPCPSDDYTEKQIDLNERLVKHPSATFYVKASGNSMIGAGIHNGDILIVDKSIKPIDGKVVIAILDGEFTVKRLRMKENGISLIAENPNNKSIEITPERDFKVWGVVIHVIHSL